MLNNLVNCAPAKATSPWISLQIISAESDGLDHSDVSFRGLISVLGIGIIGVDGFSRAIDLTSVIANAQKVDYPTRPSPTTLSHCTGNKSCLKTLNDDR